MWVTLIRLGCGAFFMVVVEVISSELSCLVESSIRWWFVGWW